MDINQAKNISSEEIYYSLNHLEAEEKAKSLGFNVIYPQDNELFIDIDNLESFNIFKERIELLYEVCPYQYKIVSSENKDNHYHIYVKFADIFNISNEDRIFLQLLLGSDPIREYLAYRSLKVGDKKTTLFFEKKNFEVPFRDKNDGKKEND